MNDSNQLICSDLKETYDATRNPDQELESNKGPINHNNLESIRNPRNPYKGVYLRKGLEKWTSEIRDPSTGRRCYLGLFTSAEAAHEAYCSKKLEIENRSASHKKQKVCTNANDANINQCHLPNESLEVKRQRKNTYKGVCLRKTGKWTSVVNDPYTHYLGTLATEEAAYEAYCASKLELDQKRATSIENAASTSCGRGKRERKPVSKPEFETPKKKPRINSVDVPYKGVRKQTSGKFDARIWDPVSKTKCYLGLYESAEAAHSAYCEKELKLDKKISKSGKGCKKLEIGKKKMWDVPYKGVRKRPSGKFEATIWDPISKTRCYIGLFESAEAANSAYCTKKLKIDMKISKFAKSCKKLEIGEENEKKRGTKQKSQEAAASVWSECSLLEECKPCLEKMEDVERKSDFVPLIVDENGFLLGEFSQIDDLAICD